jgi:hypothetical protein
VRNGCPKRTHSVSKASGVAVLNSNISWWQGITQPAPNLFEPSARDRREHEQWLRHTKRSIDFAQQVKSRVLVLHLGSVKFFWFNPAHKLKNFILKNPTASVPEDRNYQYVLAKSCARLFKCKPHQATFLALRLPCAGKTLALRLQDGAKTLPCEAKTLLMRVSCKILR